MRLSLPLALLLACAPGVRAEVHALQATVPLGDTIVIFADAATGRRILETRDEFVERLSPFDRAARLEVAGPVDEAEFLRHAGASVLEWTPEQRERIGAMLAAIAPGIAATHIDLPDVVFLVRTTGAEEGGAAYTRGAAIVLSDPILADTSAEPQRLLAHELFHVYSRTHRESRARLYGTVGFRACGELPFPARLAARRITNPDAPRNDHCIRVRHGGKERWAVPILYAGTDYDAARRGRFFEYLVFQLLLVGEDPSGAPSTAVYDRAAPKIVGLDAVEGYFEQIGRNTQYVIHPEEVVADHFALLVTGGKAESPDQVDALRKALADD